MIPKMDVPQNDFSAGEIDISMKRASDSPILKAGARQMSNWRIKNSKSLKNRPGRTALFLSTGRVEEVTLSPGNTFYLNFANATLNVFNSAGALVFTSAGLSWNLATAQQIIWDIYQLTIYIAVPNGIPLVLAWDGVSTWTLHNYNEQIIGSQKRTFFYRISPPNITMVVGGLIGSAPVTFSSNVLVAGHVGTRMRYSGRQILITAVASGTSGTVTIEETLPESCNMTFGGSIVSFFNVGDEIIGTNSGAKAIVASVSGPNMIAQYTANDNGLTLFFTASGEFIVGPSGGVQLTGLANGLNPSPIVVWDEEVMNTLRGYPAAVFVDQNRLGFCNFPSVPSGIGWSAIGNPTDLYVGTNPNSAIFELAPNKSRVLYVQAGAESSEFVFCDNGLYYIPITATNPLVPGSVAFNLLSRDGSAAVQPRLVQDLILWINAGLTSVFAIVATGAYNRPFDVRNLSELHGHLFKTPIAIAAPSTTSQFEERYVYVLNSDGTIIVGKYEIESGQVKGAVGWLPWNGAGTVKWLSAFGADVVFSTSYAPNGIAAVSVIEKLDNTQYLDGAMAVNAAPAAFAPPGSKGPLWWLAGGTVDLIDNGTRMMGTYTIDANGNLIPQFIGSENLLSANLMAGQKWTAILEPFIPQAPAGPDNQQRMRRRRVTKALVSVQESTGFVFDGSRVPAYFEGEDATQPAPMREGSYPFRPRGRDYDPRKVLVKDTPGPLTVIELGLEVTI